MASNYQADIKSDINTLALWVFSVKFQDNKSDCPKVGYIGYANGMTNAEWLTVNMAKELLAEQGKNWSDYLEYKVDSSD